MTMAAPETPSFSSSPDMRAHCWPGSKMNRMPSVRHSSAYCTIARGSFGEMMARPQSSTMADAGQLSFRIVEDCGLAIISRVVRRDDGQTAVFDDAERELAGVRHRA